MASCSRASRAATCLASAGVPGCAGLDTPAAWAKASTRDSVSLSNPSAPARLSGKAECQLDKDCARQGALQIAETPFLLRRLSLGQCNFELNDAWGQAKDFCISGSYLSYRWLLCCGCNIPAAVLDCPQTAVLVFAQLLTRWPHCWITLGSVDVAVRSMTSIHLDIGLLENASLVTAG